MFFISQLKLIKRTKTFELNLNIEFWRAVLSTTSTGRKNYGTT